MENTKKEENILIKNIRMIIFVLSILLLIVIVKNVFNNEIQGFDNNIYTTISTYISPIMNKIVKFITNLGSAFVIIPIYIISIIILRKEKISKYIAINLPIIFVLNQIVKRIIARPRPDEFRIVEETGFSFPSAHSMVSLAFYGFFIYIIYKKIENKYIKWLLISIISILIISIGLSRIYLGVHYASDVIGGFLASIIYLTIYTKIIKHNI